jgi:HK97 gp10 family phage protein
MGVKIKGQKKLIQKLEEKFGEQAAKQMADEALRAGAPVFKKELEVQLETFRDTGGTIEDVTLTDPTTSPGGRVLKVHWNGAHGRYRVVHLNEWGTVKNPNPRGKGAIARALKDSQKEYRAAIKKAVERGI